MISRGLRVKLVVAILVLFCSIRIDVRAQSTQLKFKQFTYGEGFTGRTVEDIIRDSQGFIWIGTSESGLFKYNGIYFQGYQNIANDKSSLTDDAIVSIIEDNKNRLWILTRFGLHIYDRDNDSFFKPEIYHDNVLDTLKHRYFSIYYDAPSSTLWCGLNAGFIRYKINEEKGYEVQKIKLSADYINYGDRKNDDVIFIGDVGQDNKLLIGFINHIYLFDTVEYSSKKLSDVLAVPTTFHETSFNTFLIDSKKNIWIGTKGEGLYHVNLQSKKIIQIKNIPDNPESLSGNRVFAFYEDFKGRIWVGTRLNSLNLLVPGTDIEDNPRFIHYYEDVTNPYSLSNKSIYDIYVDISGVLWVGTWNGLNYADLETKRFHTFNTNFESIENQDVKGMLYDETYNYLWIAAENGLYRYNLKNKNTKKYSYEKGNPNSLTYFLLTSIARDNDGIIWIGSHVGLTRFNPKTEQFTQYFADYSSKNTLINNFINRVFIDHDNQLWITTNAGTNKYNRESNTFSRYTPVDGHKDPNKRINGWGSQEIFEDSDNILWLSTKEGLNSFNREEKSFQDYPFLFENKGENYNKSIIVIKESVYKGNKTLWLGTMNGLIRFFPETKEYRWYAKEDGLPGNRIMSIEVDRDQNLWIGTNNGLCRYIVEEEDFTTFFEEDGILENNFIQRSSMQIADGKMYFGSFNGITSFYPKEITSNNFQPPVVFTNLKIYNKQVGIGDTILGNVVLNKNINQIENLILKPNQKVFSVEFSALSYLAQSKNKYAYKLEGFDTDWNEADADMRFATYTNLDPGTYILMVKATNNDRVWSENARSLQITILPYFWETIWFKILLILFGISLFIVLVYLRLRKQKLESLRLKVLVDERTKEITAKNRLLEEQALVLKERQKTVELQARNLKNKSLKLEEANRDLRVLNTTKDKFFSIIAHDLKNPFNVILGFLGLLSSNDSNYDDDHRRILIKNTYRAARNVYSLLENLLQWARAQSGSLKPEVVRVELNELINENIFLVRELAANKSINISFSSDENYTAKADEDMVNVVIRNLLSNAIKFTPKGGTININTRQIQKGVEIGIIDSGVGMDEKSLKNLFRIDASVSTPGTGGETGTGLGLIICKEFVEHNSGTIRVESKPNEGSRFYVLLPSG